MKTSEKSSLNDGDPMEIRGELEDKNLKVRNQASNKRGLGRINKPFIQYGNKTSEMNSNIPGCGCPTEPSKQSAPSVLNTRRLSESGMYNGLSHAKENTSISGFNDASAPIPGIGLPIDDPHYVRSWHIPKEKKFKHSPHNHKKKTSVPRINNLGGMQAAVLTSTFGSTEMQKKRQPRNMQEAVSKMTGLEGTQLPRSGLPKERNDPDEIKQTLKGTQLPRSGLPKQVEGNKKNIECPSETENYLKGKERNIQQTAATEMNNRNSLLFDQMKPQDTEQATSLKNMKTDHAKTSMSQESKSVNSGDDIHREKAVSSESTEPQNREASKAHNFFGSVAGTVAGVGTALGISQIGTAGPENPSDSFKQAKLPSNQDNSLEFDKYKTDYLTNNSTSEMTKPKEQSTINKHDTSFEDDIPGTYFGDVENNKAALDVASGKPTMVHEIHRPESTPISDMSDLENMPQKGRRSEIESGGYDDLENNEIYGGSTIAVSPFLSVPSNMISSPMRDTSMVGRGISLSSSKEIDPSYNLTVKTITPRTIPPLPSFAPEKEFYAAADHSNPNLNAASSNVRRDTRNSDNLTEIEPVHFAMDIPGGYGTKHMGVDPLEPNLVNTDRTKHGKFQYPSSRRPATEEQLRGLMIEREPLERKKSIGSVEPGSYVAEFGNLPSLVDPTIPTYGAQSNFEKGFTTTSSSGVDNTHANMGMKSTDLSIDKHSKTLNQPSQIPRTFIQDETAASDHRDRRNSLTSVWQKIRRSISNPAD